jgi:hypothetical protein
MRRLEAHRLDQGARHEVRRALLATGCETVAAVVFFYALPLDGGDWPIGALLGCLAIVGLVPIAVRRARRLLVSPRPVVATVNVLALMFVLLVLGFATVHYAIAVHAPSQYDGLETKTDSLYFTVTTVSTVGFGDIVATGQGARAFTTVQMVFDLIFLGVIVRMVTWAGRRGLAAADPGEPAGQRDAGPVTPPARP